MTREGRNEPPPVNTPASSAGAAKTIATLRGAELASATEGGQVVVRLPVPEAPPAPRGDHAEPPTPSPHRHAGAAPATGLAAARRPGATATPSPTPAPAPSGPPRTFFLYSVRTVAEGGEASASWNL